MTTLVAQDTRLEPPAPILVVTHPAGDGLWDAYIQGREPVRIDGAAELNQLLRELDLRYTRLSGFAGCDTGGCPFAATSAVLTGTGEAWLLARTCEEHQPQAIPPDAFMLPGPVTVRSRYLARFAPEVAELARILLPHDVPPALFAQPACGHCGERIAPDAGVAPRLTWRTADGTAACGTTRTHTAAPGELTAILARYAQDMRAQLHHDDEPAQLAS